MLLQPRSTQGVSTLAAALQPSHALRRLAAILACISIAATSASAQVPAGDIRKVSLEPYDSIVPPPIRIQAAARIADTSLVVVGTRIIRDGAARNVLFGRIVVDSVVRNELIEISSEAGSPAKWVGVVAAGSEFLVLWSDVRAGGWGMYLRRISASGVPLGPEVRFDVTTVWTGARIALVGSRPCVIWGISAGLTRVVFFDGAVPSPAIEVEVRFDSVRSIAGAAHELVALVGTSGWIIHENGLVEPLPVPSSRFRGTSYEWSDSTFAFITNDSVFVMRTPFDPQPFLWARLEAPAGACTVHRDSTGYVLVGALAGGQTHIKFWPILQGALGEGISRFSKIVPIYSEFFVRTDAYFQQGCDEVDRFDVQIVIRSMKSDGTRTVYFTVEVSGTNCRELPSGTSPQRPCWPSVVATRAGTRRGDSVRIEPDGLIVGVPWDQSYAPVPQLDPIIGSAKGRLQVGWIQLQAPGPTLAQLDVADDTFRIVSSHRIDQYDTSWQVRVKGSPGDWITWTYKRSLHYSWEDAGGIPVLRTDQMASDHADAYEVRRECSTTFQHYVSADPMPALTIGAVYELPTTGGSREFSPSIVRDPSTDMTAIAGSSTAIPPPTGIGSAIMRTAWRRDSAFSTAIHTRQPFTRIVPVSPSTVLALGKSGSTYVDTSGRTFTTPNVVPAARGEKLIHLGNWFLRLVPTGNAAITVERYELSGALACSTNMTLDGLQRPLPSVFPGPNDEIIVVWGARDGVRLRRLLRDLSTIDESLVVPRPVPVPSASGVFADGKISVAWCDASDGELDIYMTSLGSPITGISREIHQLDVRLTPSASTARLVVPDSGRAGILAITDVVGRRIQTRSLAPHAGTTREVSIDLEGFSAGFYAVEVLSDRTMWWGTMIVGATAD